MVVGKYDLKFDAEAHEYTLNGVHIPSVTQILRFANAESFAGVDPAVLRAAADRGTRVHEATVDHDFDEDCLVDSDIKGYIDAYAAFKRDYQVRSWDAYEWMGAFVSAIEPRNNYAGTIDRIGKVDGEQMIIDIKTGSVDKHSKPRYFAQLYAYRNIWRTDYMMRNNHIGIAILKLSSNGSYNYYLADSQDEQDAHDVWAACHNLNRVFAKEK